MKIAFFTDDYLPYVHGVTRSIQNYREALEAQGHEVWIVAPKPRQKDFEDDDDHVIRLPSVNSYIFDKRPVSLLYPGIARKLDPYDFDIIHSQTQFYLFAIAGMVAKRKNIPHISTVHTLYTELLDDYPTAVTAGLIAVSIGFPFVYKTKPILPFTSASEIRELTLAEKGEIRKKQGWRLMAACLNQADGGVAPSKHLSKTLIDSGAEVPMHILTNGIDTQMFANARAADSPLKKARGEQFIVCVARISGEKRQYVLIEAMKLLRNKHAKLVLVGDGPETDTLKALVKQLRLGKRVIFTGIQTPDTIAAIMKQADLFVLPSYRFDNQPMVILEAIASGLPVVYCDDNLREGLTKHNALLTEDTEADAFASAFDELLADPARMKRMSAASVKQSAKFERSVLTKKLVKLYQQYIDQMPAVE